MTAEAVLVFARAPVAGEVKTRLSAGLGIGQTLELYRAFLSDTLESARRAASNVFLAHTPSPPFPEMARADVVFEQRGRGFGERFDWALADARAALPRDSSVIVIGADTPHLSPFAIRRAFDALRRSGGVLGPSEDGGFYLLGVRGPTPPLSRCFDAPERAFTRVESALRGAGIEVACLDSLFDVDNAADLDRLNSLLRSGRNGSAEWIPPATSRLLASPPAPGPSQRTAAALSTASMPDSRA